jgi:Type I phosphodiesterase / nucleotide pyrophosphatase
MANITSELIPRLKANRLPKLELPDNFIIPEYDATSIRGIPASIAKLLSAPDFPTPPLTPELTLPLSGDIRKVILILVDALALSRFQRWMELDKSLIWGELAKEGIRGCLTSVIPSTTSTCLPTIWSGLTPAVHGFVGYELWLKEFGVVANMIKHTPFNIDRTGGTLEEAGFRPETALPGVTLGTHLRDAGIDVKAFQHNAIRKSGLSRLFLRDVDERSYITTTDLWFNLRETVEQDREKKGLYWVYWGDIDYFSHNYGPDSPRCLEAFKRFSAGFANIFLEKLGPDLRTGTLVILTADHGQIFTPADPFYELKSHPGLERRLHILPTGENRLIYFFIKPGQTEAVRESLERIYPNTFTLLDPNSAIDGGLFGPGDPHPRLRERLGDLIAIAHRDAYLWWSIKDNTLRGRHGGMIEDEMLVPFFAARL